MSGLASSRRASHTLALPFLYPCLDRNWQTSRSLREDIIRNLRPRRRHLHQRRWNSTQTVASDPSPAPSQPPPTPEQLDQASQYDHLSPQPADYSQTPFTDSCALTLAAGAGGHGCISFLREKYIAAGPANGGDGGTGGNVYIQAVSGETSLHKLARRGIVKAGRGRNGQGKLKGGARGEDVLISVPVGTVVREVWRRDPVEDEDVAARLARGMGTDAEGDADANAHAHGVDQSTKWRRENWLLYPGALPSAFTSADFPALPRPRRSNIALQQPPAPLHLDLDTPTAAPLLLAAGATGGLGNPHFVTKSIPRPRFGTKGAAGTSLHVQLELKLLADVGLVGLPNAGKSTLLRALTSSRARVGAWAFTTLQPNIGTVVLDDFRARPVLGGDAALRRAQPRTGLSIADIPGLIEDAHLDKGLGLGFLRHIERAAVLAFVLDLGAGGAVEALKGLWREVGEYEKRREARLNAESARAVESAEGMVAFTPFASTAAAPMDFGSGGAAAGSGDAVVLEPEADRALPPLALPPISSKPWMVVATKADLPDTQGNFDALQRYLRDVQAGAVAHPSGKEIAWRRTMHAVPVSAINKEGVQGIPGIVVELLEG